MLKLKQIMLEIKTCRKCKKTHLITNFDKANNSKDGYNTVCKSCQRSYREKRTLKYLRLHPLEDKKINIIFHKLTKKEKEKIDQKCYDEFMKNTTVPPRTLKQTKITKGICPICIEREVQSRHHIIPRKYTVNNDKTNLILLCNRCHDIIEIKTEEWIESGKRYNIDLLKSMILNDGFTDYSNSVKS